MKAELITKSNKKARTAKLQRSRGSSLIEVMIAVVVLTLGISSATLLVFSNQSLKIDVATNNEALGKAEAQLEEMRAKSRQDFSSVLSIAPSVDDIYTKSVDVVNIDDYTKKITSNISWNVSAVRPLAINFTTWVTDPAGASGGDTCNPTLTGDWTNPTLLGTADFSSSEGGTDVDVFGKKAYITTDPSAANKPDFYIVNTSDPELSDLPILGSVNTGPGLSAVHIAGHFAYVANMSTTAQLQVIDISDASDPTLEKSFDVTLAGDTAVGNSIFYLNKKIYLGLTKSTGKEFYVIDVSDPLNPVVNASFETNTQINNIIVKNNIAYLSVPDNSLSAAPEQLRILNVSQANAGIITELNPFSYPNASTMSGQGLYLSKDGETLYFGRGGANSAHNPEFFSLDVSNPASINQIDSKYLGSTANAMTVRQNLAFMVTSDPSLGFQIWDLDNLSNPSPYGSINVEQTSTGGMDCEGNYMYVAQKSNKALQIVGPYIPSTYALSNSGNITVTQGQSGGNTITATIISGTPPSVSFSISGLPAGAVPTFNPTNCTPNCSTTLSISTNYPATPAGTYPILVTGTGGITTTFNLIVNPLPIPFDYSLSVMPATIAMNRGSLASTIITVTKISGIAQPVTITVSGMQNNVTITPNPVSCTPNNSCNITLNITAAGNAQRVTRTITVTGNLPTRTTTFTLTIN